MLLGYSDKKELKARYMTVWVTGSAMQQCSQHTGMLKSDNKHKWQFLMAVKQGSTTWIYLDGIYIKHATEMITQVIMLACANPLLPIRELIA